MYAWRIHLCLAASWSPQSSMLSSAFLYDRQEQHRWLSVTHISVNNNLTYHGSHCWTWQSRLNSIELYWSVLSNVLDMGASGEVGVEGNSRYFTWLIMGCLQWLVKAPAMLLEELTATLQLPANVCIGLTLEFVICKVYVQIGAESCSVICKQWQPHSRHPWHIVDKDQEHKRSQVLWNSNSYISLQRKGFLHLHLKTSDQTNVAV